MGYYIKFISKELRLRKDTPQEVIDFINDCVNNHNFNVIFNHKFFTLKNWDTIFMSNYWLKEETYFKNENEQWRLRVACDINYGRNEILQFTEWISPYVIGHKPKEYIGQLDGEDRGDKQNVYIQRATPTTDKNYEN